MSVCTLKFSPSINLDSSKSLMSLYVNFTGLQLDYSSPPVRRIENLFEIFADVYKDTLNSCSLSCKKDRENCGAFCSNNLNPHDIFIMLRKDKESHDFIINSVPKDKKNLALLLQTSILHYKHSPNSYFYYTPEEHSILPNGRTFAYLAVTKKDDLKWKSQLANSLKSNQQQEISQAKPNQKQETVPAGPDQNPDATGANQNRDASKPDATKPDQKTAETGSSWSTGSFLVGLGVGAIGGLGLYAKQKSQQKNPQKPHS